MSEKELGKKKPAEKPISLHPLKFEKAVESLLKVRPNPKKGENRDE